MSKKCSANADTCPLMVYLDTSAAVPLFVSEPASELIDRWLVGKPFTFAVFVQGDRLDERLDEVFFGEKLQ